MTLTLWAQLLTRRLDLQLEMGDRERVAILGPNGAGKSSTLAVLAGLLKPDRGRAELDGQVLFDLSSGGGSWLPPHRRNVALMAQQPLLFPHLTVTDNVAFGPRSQGSRRVRARRIAEHWLAEVGASDLADRRPGQLSGGQAQRVAIARALAGDPRLLLLDEPLAALDVDAAPLLRSVLRRVLVDRSAVLVTHDLLDALILTDRVVVIESGQVSELGATVEVLRRPRTSFTARLAGLNLVPGTAVERGVRQVGGVTVEGIAASPLVVGEPAVAVFPPSAVSVFTASPHGSPRNTFAVTLTELEPREGQMRLRAVTASGQLLSADVTLPVVAELGLGPGAQVQFSLKASAVHLYPA